MIETQQILIPKKVHIGDTAELRCTFTSDSQELASLVAQTTSPLPLPPSVFSTPFDSKDFEILTVSLAPADKNYYQLSISFIPWKSGALKLPDLTIADVNIAIKSEEIVSLAKQFNATTLKESTAPLLLPGTTYKLWFSFIFGILFLILCISLIVKHKKVSFFFKNKILKIKYIKNKRITIKKLRKLIKKDGTGTYGQEASDLEVSENIQHILRNYLEFRFNYPFTKTVTSEMAEIYKMKETFYSITKNHDSNNNDNLNKDSSYNTDNTDSKDEAFGEIVKAFVRTDYIRYGSSNKNSKFLDGEKSDFIENIINMIEILEKDDNIKKNDEKKIAPKTKLETSPKMEDNNA